MGLIWRASDHGGPLTESGSFDLYSLLEGGGLFSAIMSLRCAVPTAQPGSAHINARLRWTEKGTGFERAYDSGLHALNENIDNLIPSPGPIVYIEPYVELGPGLLVIEFQRFGESEDGAFDFELRLI